MTVTDEYLPISILCLRFGISDSAMRRVVTTHAKHVRRTRLDADMFHTAKNAAMVTCYHVGDVRKVMTCFRTNPNNAKHR